MAKKIFVLFLACLAGLWQAKASDVFRVNNVVMEAGGEATIDIMSNFSDDYPAFAADIILPEGLTLKKNSDGTPVAELGFSTNAFAYSSTSGYPEEGHNKFAAMSNDFTSYLPLNGSLLKLKVLCSPSIANGTVLSCQFEGEVSDIHGNVTFDNKTFHVTVGTPTNDVVTVNNIEAMAGGTAEMVINLSTTATNYTGYQMSLYLPEGVTLQKDEDDDYLYTLSSRHNKNHVFSVNPQADGGLMLVCYSMTKKTIATGDGELLRLPVNIASTVTSSLQGNVKSIKFSDTSGNTYPANNVQVSFTISEPVAPPAQSLIGDAVPELVAYYHGADQAEYVTDFIEVDQTALAVLANTNSTWSFAAWENDANNKDIIGAAGERAGEETAWTVTSIAPYQVYFYNESKTQLSSNPSYFSKSNIANVKYIKICVSYNNFRKYLDGETYKQSIKAKDNNTQNTIAEFSVAFKKVMPGMPVTWTEFKTADQYNNNTFNLYPMAPDNSYANLCSTNWTTSADGKNMAINGTKVGADLKNFFSSRYIAANSFAYTPDDSYSIVGSANYKKALNLPNTFKMYIENAAWYTYDQTWIESVYDFAANSTTNRYELTKSTGLGDEFNLISHTVAASATKHATKITYSYPGVSTRIENGVWVVAGDYEVNDASFVCSTSFVDPFARPTQSLLNDGSNPYTFSTTYAVAPPAAGIQLKFFKLTGQYQNAAPYTDTLDKMLANGIWKINGDATIIADNGMSYYNITNASTIAADGAVKIANKFTDESGRPNSNVTVQLTIPLVNILGGTYNFTFSFIMSRDGSTVQNITFADSEVKALCVANWDTDGDGELSKTEAAAVTNLGTVFKEKNNIKTFDELQYFTGLTSIGSYAFSSCTGLTDINIPSGVTSIGFRAFLNCSGLNYFTFPNSVASIGSDAFAYCSNLTDINIPSSVASIGDGAFSGCSGLTSIIVESGNINYDSRDNSNAIISKSNNTLISGCKKTTVPSSVTSIGTAAFYGCSGLTAITIPSSVTSIGRYAFSYCSGLTSITLPSSVISINNSAFSECNFTSVNVENSIPVEITSDVFSNHTNTTLYVPKGSKAAYELADYWKEFKKIEESGESDNIDVTDISTMDNVIYIEPFEAKTGTQTTISFKMKNSSNIRSFQFDLYLPEGVTAVKSSKGRIQGALSENRLPEEDEHKLTFSEHEGGIIRFLCDSEYGDTFTGSDGEIATLLVNISESMADGDYPIVIKDMKLSEVDIANYYQTAIVKTKISVSSYVMGDINGDNVVDVSDYSGVASHIHGNTPNGFVMKAADVDESGNIDVSDYSGIANIIHYGSIHGNVNAQQARSLMRKTTTSIGDFDNVIYISPFSATAGTQTTISICMKNTVEIRSFQFDLNLPDGITVVKSSKGRIQGALSKNRLPEEDAHSLSFSEHEGGVIRFLCDSEYGDTFTGSDGEIATLLVNISETMVDGDYPIIMNDMKLSEVDIANYYIANNIETTITIGAADTRIVLDEASTTEPAVAENVDVRVKRTIKADEWSTICLPFAMTESQVKAAFGNDVVLGDFNGYEVLEDASEQIVVGINVKFNTATAITANHPYIIKVSSPVSEFTVDGVDVDPEEEPMVNFGTKRKPKAMVGTYVAGTAIENGCLFLNANKFWYSVGSTKIKAFRAYFDFVDLLPDFEDNYATSRISMSFDDVTGIDTMPTLDGDANRIYDLQGRQVTKPAKGGLYIQNGKKVVVKSNK